MKSCPCGCGRPISWSARRAAHPAGLVVHQLPMAHRTAVVLERQGSGDAPEARAFVDRGLRYAERALAVVHGGNPPARDPSMPPEGEGVAWFRIAERLAFSMPTLDPEWWQWYVARGEPPADLEHDAGRWNGEVRGDGPPEPPPD